MKSRKRWRLAALILGVFLTTALIASGCGDGHDAAAEAIHVGLVFDLGGRGDQSFNDSAAAGLDRAIADFGITHDEVSPNSDGSNRGSLLELQSDNADLVLGVGFLFADDMNNVAAANPDTCYAIVDGTIEQAADNISMLLFAEHEGSFLVGAAAAWKTGADHVGFIGGVNIPLIQRFEAGFLAGARHVNPDIEFASQYISEPPDFDGFNAPDAAKVIAESMFEDGADIVYHAAGGSGAGLFEAAKEHSESGGSKVWAIGADSDQYNTSDTSVREYILTSSLKRVDVSVYETIAAVNGGTCPGGVKEFNLKNGGMGYSTTGGFVDDITAELDGLKDDIIAGDITVPDSLG